MRIDPPPSRPLARLTRPLATAAADPLEEPPTVRPWRHGLWVTPLILVTLTLRPPNSLAVVWTTGTAPPCSSSRSITVVTADPHAVWERCRVAGIAVLREPAEPHYDSGGMGFSVRDPEGNAWSFGTYAGGATE